MISSTEYNILYVFVKIKQLAMVTVRRLWTS